MANLFSRVGMKNGDRAGEVILHPGTFGDVLHPRRSIAMPPTPLDGKPLPLEDTADRRAHFVDWLTASDNPYFAKALVNRVWKNFLGRGLVEAEDDLRETNPPTNRELFDALARDFIEHKYDVKHLVRLVMNSAAYQRSSRPVKGNEADDRFYSKYLVRRLSGEVILDALSQVTGVPTRIHAGLHRSRRRHGRDQQLPRRHAGPAASGFAGGVEFPRRLRPSRSRADLLVRAAAGLDRRAGAHAQQRTIAERQAALAEGEVE